MTHALRADSVHMILDTYERLEQAHGPRDRRLRIEHADLIDAADMPRFAATQGDCRHAAHVLLRRGRRQLRSRRRGAVRPLAFPRAQRRRAGIQQRLAVHLAAGSLRVDSAGGDAAGVALGGYGQCRRRSRWTAPAQGGAVHRPARFTSRRSGSRWPKRFAPTRQGRPTPRLPTTKSARWKSASWRIWPCCRRTYSASPLETIGKTRVVTTMVGGKIVYSAPQ